MSYTTNIKKENFRISIRLDNRRKKDSGKYPVKLRVYSKATQKEKWYALDIDLTEQEFKIIWINEDNKNLRGRNKETRLKLQAIEARANDEAKQLTVFDFALFETKLFRKSTDKNNLKYHFDLVIERNLKNNKVGTAESYKYTFNSLLEFSVNKKNCNSKKLTFNAITVDWLKEYESYMIEKGKSYTTIGVYTRTLRAVFNNAIIANDISQDIYPFGQKKDNKYKTQKLKKSKRL